MAVSGGRRTLESYCVRQDTHRYGGVKSVLASTLTTEFSGPRHASPVSYMAIVGHLLSQLMSCKPRNFVRVQQVMLEDGHE